MIEVKKETLESIVLILTIIKILFKPTKKLYKIIKKASKRLMKTIIISVIYVATLIAIIVMDEGVQWLDWAYGVAGGYIATKLYHMLKRGNNV